MKQVVAIFVLFLALASAEFKDKTEEEFLKTSEQCSKRLKVAHSYQPKFENFEYPDDHIVHRYLRCVFLDLELWDDKNGFNVEHVAYLYRDRAKPEVLVPILSECNRNTQNDPPLRWVHRGFQCILDSRVGAWFKEDIIKEASKS